MSMDWFRSHHGAPTDPKWLLIAKRANVRPIHVIGTWWALLDYASQHSDRGSIDGFDIETFALFAGLDDEHVSRIVTTLRDKGLIDGVHIAQWTKRQPKREDDGAADRQRKSRAIKKESGGNPWVSGSQSKPDQEAADDRHAVSRNVTPDKKRLDKSSVPNGTGALAPIGATDFCKAVFDSGVVILTASGMSDRNARGHIGRLRGRLKDDPTMLTILREAEIHQPSEPAAWLTAAVESRLGNRSHPARVIDAADQFIADGQLH